MKKLIKKSTTVIMIVVMLATIFVESDVQKVSAASGVKSIKVTNLKTKSLTLNKGKTKTLNVKVKTNGKKTSKAFTVKSSNAKVVKAVKSGNNVKLTAKKNGTAKITIKSKVNKKKKINLTVKVKTPVKQIKLNQTSVTLEEGKSTTLSATVAPSDASNKKVIWTTSNSAVATVSSAGVVKAVKEGSATITAKAADGSNKSVTCKIVVKKAPNKIVSAQAIWKDAIRVDLARAQVLTKDNFALMIKSADVPSYVMKLEVSYVSTKDNKTYTIFPKSNKSFTLEDDIKISITGLEGTNTASVYEIHGVDNSVIIEDYETCIAEYSETKYASVYVKSEMVGCYTYSYDKLPKGATIEKQNDELYIKYYPNYYENMISTFKFKDDLGNECTKKVYFGVYDNTHIYSYVPDTTVVTSGVYYLSKYIGNKGGSGSYKYEIVSAPASVYIDHGSHVRGSLLPGKYQIKYKVIDVNDDSISFNGSFNVTVKDGKTVSGRITDANGRDMTDCYVRAIKNDEKSSGASGSYIIGEENGTGHYSMILEPGTYTLVADDYNYRAFMYDVKVTEDMEGLDFKLPLYLVSIDMSGYRSMGYWSDKDGIKMGYGGALYMQKGKNELTTTATKYNGESVKVKISINVTGDMTVKPVEVTN